MVSQICIGLCTSKYIQSLCESPPCSVFMVLSKVLSGRMTVLFCLLHGTLQFMPIYSKNLDNSSHIHVQYCLSSWIKSLSQEQNFTSGFYVSRFALTMAVLAVDSLKTFIICQTVRTVQAVFFNDYSADPSSYCATSVHTFLPFSVIE